MIDTRPNLRRPRYGEITQGTVFSCASAGRYGNCEVHGLTITARCDVAQHKYPVLNFIPVVRLSDWLRRDGLDILVDTETSDQAGTLKAILRQINLSPALVDVVPLNEIADKHFPLLNVTSKEKIISEKFRQHIALINDFKMLIKGDPECTFVWFSVNRRNKIEDLIKRLSKHSILGHYFLENISLDSDHASGYVCLLREVSTLPKSIAEQLGKGIEKNQHENICAKEGQPSSLSISEHDMAMPVVEVSSPTLEHILQNFSFLFGRIGVADPVESAISTIIQNSLVMEIGAAP